MHQHFDNSSDDAAEATLNFHLVDEAPPEDIAQTTGMTEKLSYETRLKQISSTKFKGDKANVESGSKTPNVEDTREFEYIEKELAAGEGATEIGFAKDESPIK